MTSRWFPHLLCAALCATLPACHTPESAHAPEPAAPAASPSPARPLSPVAPLTASPQGDGETLRREIASLLDGYEQEPTAAQLAAHTTDPAALHAALRAIYEDRAESAIHRSRALSLMRHLPAELAAPTLEQVLLDLDTANTHRRVALRAYAALPEHDPFAILAQLLHHPDAPTRMIAATELVACAAPQARDALRTRAAIEPEAHVRAHIEALLQREAAPAVSPAPSQPVTSQR